MFIIESDGVIYGVGSTVESATANAREFVEIDCVTLLDGNQSYPAGCVAVWPATERLVDAARRDALGLRWQWNRELRLADLA